MLSGDRVGRSVRIGLALVGRRSTSADTDTRAVAFDLSELPMVVASTLSLSGSRA